MTNKKLNKEQREKIGIILSWYNLAWAMSNCKNDSDKKRIAEEASKMIEDIILNQ